MDINEIETKSKLLKRQIRKKLSSLNCSNYGRILEFIQVIDDEYTDAKENRELLEKSLELSSQEHSENNIKLRRIVLKNIKINEKLETGKNHLSMILDNLGEGLVVIDGNMNIVLANKKASELSNFKINDLIGKKYNKYINFLEEKNKKGNKETKDYISLSLEKGKEYILDQNIVLKGRRVEVPVFVTFTPLNNYSLDGKNACIVVFRDATKDRELANLKNEFLSVASHELRTPMTVIKGFSSLLIKGKLGAITEKQKNYLEKIHLNTSNLIEMVNDMLDINKLEAGKMEFINNTFNISKTIENSISDMEDFFSKKNIIINYKKSDFIINSDEKKIKQVIINLLSNSYKFSNKNTEVEVKIEKINNNLKILVIDQGNGIKEENITKLFKKFSQVGNHLNKTEKGTGLGLSLSKKIIEGLGGTIGVKSIFGEGSTFYFILPYKKEGY